MNNRFLTLYDIYQVLIYKLKWDNMAAKDETGELEKLIMKCISIPVMMTRIRVKFKIYSVLVLQNRNNRYEVLLI